MEQWKEFENDWEVQEEWYDKAKAKQSWNTLGLCQQDADRHGQGKDRQGHADGNSEGQGNSWECGEEPVFAWAEGEL